MENETKPTAAEFYTVAEAAERLRVSAGTVRNLLKADELHAVRFGRTIRIPVAELDRFIAAKTAAGDPADSKT